MEYFSSCDFYLLRRPLKPIDELLALSNKVEEEGEKGFGEKIKQIFSSPDMEEAIYTASPDLFSELKKWQKGENLESKEYDKLLRSLYKYYTRMCMRCTPYGLFAGCAMGSIRNGNTGIDFLTFGNDNFYKHSRLDMNYVAEITEYLLKDPIIRKQIKFCPNSSLYKVGDTYRYVEFVLKNKRRSYFLSSVGSSIYIEKVLEFTKGGKHIDDIASALIKAGFNSEAEAINFVELIIKAQMLVSDLEPTVTGNEYFLTLIRKLKSLKGTKGYVDILEKITTLLKKQDNSVERYVYIKSLIDQNFVATSSKDLIQTDLFLKPKNNILNKTIVDLLTKNFVKLLWLDNRPANTHLETFCKKFLAKYEEQEIPLIISLDSEVGVGYGLNINGVSDYMPLLKDVTIPKEQKATSVTWNRLIKLKYEKFSEAKTTGGKIIEITDNDIEELTNESPQQAQLPSSLYLFGTFLSKSANDIDQGNFKFLLSALAGPSAANLLGRFCHGNPQLTKKLQECLKEEEQDNPNAIYAEIVHLSEARTGNILMRPNLRRYEIPYLGQASVSEEYQIPVDDLLVSIQQGKIFLRSKKFNKQVIPRLTSAHNFSHGLPIYKFLCDLQFQDRALGVFWNWFPFEQETYLPRVEYKNIILSRARWHLKKKDYPELNKHSNLVKFFYSLREQWKIPKYVVTREGDNELLVDFDNLHCIQTLAQDLQKRNVVLYEFLSTPDQCFIKDSRGSYTNEVIIPLRKNSLQIQRSLISINMGSFLIKRQFIPGSEWLYVKIYTGNKTIDKVLTDIILPLTQKLLADEIIDKWFFIRFNDPDGHLRIRFHHSTREDFWKEVLQRLYEKLNPLLEQGLISKVLMDTYQREIERYGADTMALSEELFFSDSLAIVEFLDLVEGDEGERYRWLFALRNVDFLLNDFGYGPEDKYHLLKDLQKGFFEEFNNKSKEDNLRHSLNDKYRIDTKAIVNILNPEKDTEEILSAGACFERRSERNKPIIQMIREQKKPFDHGKSLNEMLSSYIHMTMNRTFISRQRMHELVIYHYLSKYYKSQLAREKNKRQEYKLTYATELDLHR